MRPLLPLLLVLLAPLSAAAFPQAWLDVDVVPVGDGAFAWRLTACSATRGRVELVAAVVPPDARPALLPFTLGRDATCGWTLDVSGLLASGALGSVGRCAHVVAALRVDAVAGDAAVPAGQASGSACGG